MTTAPSPVPRMFAFMESRQLGVAWLCAVVLGAAVISSDPTVTLHRVLLPVAIMIFYGVFVFNRGSSLFASASQAYKLSIIAQLADSMYFMGFIWTLWALIDSFVIHQINTADAIFRSFGYALVTTATGMFSRLAILQFKYTATDQSAGAQESVEEQLLKFSVSLQATNNVLAEWQTTLAAASGTLSSANSELNASLQTIQTSVTKTIGAATDSYGAMLGGTFANFAKQLDSMEQGIKKSLHEGITEGLKGFGQEVSANMNQLREATAGLISTLKRTNTGLGKSIVDLTSTVDATALQVQTAGSTLASTAQRTTTAVELATGSLQAATMKLESTVAKTQESIQAATGSMVRSMTDLSGEIKREIILGLSGITVSPRVPITIDDNVLTNVLIPLHEQLEQIRTQASGIQKTLNADVAKVSSTRDISEHVDSALKTAVADISGKLEAVQGELVRPMWGRLFGR